MMRKSYFSFLSVAIVMAMIAVPILSAAETPGGAQRPSRVVAQINENQLITLGGHLLPWANAANDLGAAPDSMKVNLHLVLKRSDPQEAALQTLLAEQQNSKSGNYRKWLTPAEYGARFGISESDLAKVTAWLTSHGFVVDKVVKGNNLITFTGTNAQVQQALHTTLHQYRVGSELHYANASNPMVPAALAPVMVGFQGLNDLTPKPMHATTNKIATRKKGDKQWQVVDTPSADDSLSPLFEFKNPGNDVNYHLVSPGDFATMYGVQPVYDTYDGTGQTIAIVSRADIRTQDVDFFRETFGLPATKLNRIFVGQNPGYADHASEMEATLDVQWSGAVAKNATIDLVASLDVFESVVYVIDNDLAPVMSISYGLCEKQLGIAGNALMAELYKQAASQGITVVVASGDSGSDTCDYTMPWHYSYYGLSVNGLASTPYNVAVGGTDFPVNELGDETAYWDSTNATDLHSAKSYVPEAPWNNTCASSEVLAKLLQDPDWAADATNELLCNDPAAQKWFLDITGGGGGASNCIDSNSWTTADCKAGHPQPAWQTGVPGVTADSRRQLPDVSFFAGSGMWRSGYAFCQSDTTPTGMCGGDNQIYNVGGGTSFAAPAFAGIVALLNQKANSRVGNINYTLYQLAAEQFNDPVRKDGCQIGDTTVGSASGCVFHDITQGNNRVPCKAGTVDNPPDGTCTVADSSHTYGIISGYDAGVGFDMASGLGSVNAYNLLNSWPTTLQDTQTALTLTTSSSLEYGVPLTGTGTVTVTAASGTPTGTAALMYKDAAGNAHSGWASNDLVNGTGNLTLADSILPVGTSKLYARYGGDAVYAASVSAEQEITVTPAITTLELTTSRTSVAPYETTRLTATITSTSLGDSLTGKVTFKNETTGAVIATVKVSAYKDGSTGNAYAVASAKTGPGDLTHGDNQITATFTGDDKYLGATGSAPTIAYTGGISLGASSGSLTLSPGATSGNTLVFTVRPLSAGVPISASSINFSCPGTLPAGVTCQFSAPTSNVDGSAYSTLTVFLSSPLSPSSATPSSPKPQDHVRYGIAEYLGMVIFGCALVAAPRKPRAVITLCMVLVLLVLAFSFGCGGGGSKSTSQTPATVTTTLTVSSPTPALNSPVTLTATLSNRASAGTVTFFDGTKSLGSAPVSNGTASITTSSLPVGTRSLTATYSGDGTYAAATSAAVAVDVTFTSTLTAKALDTDTGDFAQQSITLTVK